MYDQAAYAENEEHQTTGGKQWSKAEDYTQFKLFCQESVLWLLNPFLVNVPFSETTQMCNFSRVLS